LKTTALTRSKAITGGIHGILKPELTEPTHKARHSGTRLFGYSLVKNINLPGKSMQGQTWARAYTGEAN
jgi:hypothetical protein